jgi:hypothetical protein
MEVSGQLHTLAILPPGERTPVPTGKEAGWAPELFWTLWKKEKFLAPAENQSPIHWLSTSSLSAIHLTKKLDFQCKQKKSEAKHFKARKSRRWKFNTEQNLSFSKNEFLIIQ